MWSGEKKKGREKERERERVSFFHTWEKRLPNALAGERGITYFYKIRP